MTITGLPGIFDGEHGFILERMANGRMHLINREKYSGILSPIMRLLPMMKAAPAGFTAMNLQVKQQAESLANRQQIKE